MSMSLRNASAERWSLSERWTGVQIEDRAGIGLFCPGQETVIIPLDQPDGAVDPLHLILAKVILAKVIANLIEETFQHVSWNIDLGDHFSRGIGCVKLGVNFLGGVVGVDAQLMSIGPIDLGVGREIVSRILFESRFLVGVGEIEELPPILLG
jgi:hypothetical protein